MKSNRSTAWVLTFVALMSIGSLARAGFTPIAVNRKEPNQQAILQHVLGGTFVADGLNFTNGTITATRIDDDQDQTFPGKKFVATAVARFSDYTQAFGTIEIGDFIKSFDVSGNHYDVSGSGVIDLTRGIAVGRSGNSSTNSSVMVDNTDGRDHVVTYQITGDGPGLEYMLFWEDLNLPMGPALRSSADFNDVVVDLKSTGSGNVIPLPPALMTGSALIATIVLLRARIKLVRALSS